jgi:hypothetical protein
MLTYTMGYDMLRSCCLYSSEMPEAATGGSGKIRPPRRSLLLQPPRAHTCSEGCYCNTRSIMADRPGAETKPKCTPAELLLKVILTGTFSHYETRGMIDDKRLEHMLSAGKQILYKTHQESDVRYALSFSPPSTSVLTRSSDTAWACRLIFGRASRTF